MLKIEKISLKKYFLIALISYAFFNNYLIAGDQPEFKSSLFAAGILPIVVRNSGSNSVILGREKAHGYEGAGQWCDFSGGSDPKEDEGNSFLAAMRECKQEARLKYVWKDLHAKNGIEKHMLDNIKSCVIFAFQHEDAPDTLQYGVMYLPDIKSSYRNWLFNNFKQVEFEIESQERLPKSERDALLEKTDLLECDYQKLLAYANNQNNSLDLLSLTPNTVLNSPAKPKLRDVFLYLLQSIKPENKVDDSAFPMEIYISSKRARFDFTRGTNCYEDGFELTRAQKKSLCEKVKQDLLQAREKFTSQVADQPDLIESSQNSGVAEKNSWISYKNILLLMVFSSCGIGLYYILTLNK